MNAAYAPHGENIDADHAGDVHCSGHCYSTVLAAVVVVVVVAIVVILFESITTKGIRSQTMGQLTQTELAYHSQKLW